MNAATSDLMTDTEVAEFLRISLRTLQNHLKNGPPTERNPNTHDIRLVDRVVIGGQRRWSRASLMEMINGN